MESDDLLYPPAFGSLSGSSQDVVRIVIHRIRDCKEAYCLIWGGSTTISQNTAYCDLDLWAVVRNVKEAKTFLLREFSVLEHLIFYKECGYLPWLGELISMFFFDDFSLAIDVGVCGENDLPEINPGASPCFVWGESEQVSVCLRHQEYVVDTQERLKNILINMLKIRKNILRGHLWNALEYLSRARRELMGLYTDATRTKPINYSRPDRDIESVLSENELRLFSDICPIYTTESILDCSLRTLDGLSKWAGDYYFDGYLDKEIPKIKRLLEGMRSYG